MPSDVPAKILGIFRPKRGSQLGIEQSALAARDGSDAMEHVTSRRLLLLLMLLLSLLLLLLLLLLSLLLLLLLLLFSH